MSFKKNVLRHLKNGGTLTVGEAFELYGSLKLQARLSEFRREGIKIEDRWIDLPSGKRVKRYWIES